MLVSFSVRNFRCFRDEAILDLRAPRRSAIGATPWDGNIQTVAGIYGANASGKTTLFRAIDTMADQVRDSYRMSLVSSEPYAFDRNSLERPTEFSATFLAEDGACYAYGFSTMNGRVVEEWAERYTTARRTMLFERKGLAVKFGAALTGPNRAVQKTMRDTNLYLSAAAAAGHDALAPVYGWFLNQLHPFAALGFDSVLSHVVTTLASDAERRNRVAAILGRAELGLQGLEIDVRELTETERAQFQRAAEMMRTLTGQDLTRDLPTESYRVFGAHVSGGQHYKLPLEDESDGTRAMLCHAFAIDEALRSGATVVFDEIDASLHPLLVRALVQTFQDQELNPRQAQLVFTTHDVSLMEAGYRDGSQLGRDEVWITEKDSAGASSLVALADYGPRDRENLARRYMSGRFGGIPVQISLVDPVLV